MQGQTDGPGGRFIIHPHPRRGEMSFFCDQHYGRTPEGSGDPLRYGKILMAIAGADGEVAPKEMEALKNIARGLGTPDHVIDEVGEFDYKNANLEKLIDGETPSRALLYDAMVASTADGTYSEKERAAAARAAALLGVDSSVLAAIEGLLQVEISLRKARADLLFPEGMRA
jgi:tellurite resistance protein